MFGWQSQCQTHVKVDFLSPFLEGRDKFLHLKSHSKILNLMIREPFYSHILKYMKRFLSCKKF